MTKKNTEAGYGHAASTVALTILLTCAATLVLAVISGLFSMFLAHLPHSPLSIEQTKGTVNAFTLLIGVVFTPCVLHILFAAAQRRESIPARFRYALGSMRKYYARILVVIILGAVAGLIVTLLFSVLPTHVISWVLERVCYIAVGVYVMYRVFSMYHKGKKPSIFKGSRSPHASNGGTHPSSDLHFPGSATNYASPDLIPLARQHAHPAAHKALRLFLAVLLVSGSLPSLWLYALSDARVALAAQLSANDDTIEQPTEANTFIPPEQAEPEVALKEPIPADEPDIPEGAIEEIEHDRYSRTYQNSDGTFTTRIQNEPLTYTDEEGEERDIDNTITDVGEAFTNAANSYSVELPKEGGGIGLRVDGYTLDIEPLFGELGNATTRGNSIYYNAVAEGIDIQYTLFGSEVKEDIILAHPTELASFDYELIAPGITFVLEDNVVYGYPSAASDSPDAAPLFILDAPVMLDSAGNISGDIKLELIEATSDTDPLVRIIPDAEWLAAPERAWPVTIDPSHALGDANLTQRTIQAFAGPSSGPDMEHSVSYLYVGLEDGRLVGVPPIVYGQSWSFIKINDISPYIGDLPDRSILSAKLTAYKYSDFARSTPRFVDAKMVMDPWSGNGRYTWNNRPRGGGLTDLDSQEVSGANAWFEWDITLAFKTWKDDPSTNRGIMLTPRSEAQPAVCFSGTGNAHGQRALYIDLSWTVPNPVDEGMALDAPNVNLRPLTFKNAAGLQNFTGLFSDGTVRPALQVDYALLASGDTGVTVVDAGRFDKALFEPDFPDSNPFSSEVDFQLGYTGLYESNWQSKLFLGSLFDLDTLYNVAAQGTRVYDAWMNPDDVFEQTPVGLSDNFIVYQFKQQDTLPYVAAYYGVTRDQIVRDNRTGDELALPGNTLFIRNPNQNATIPYTRTDDLTLQHKRDLIYANMGRSQVSEFDMEPVNMNTGNFYMESSDFTTSELGREFGFSRSYNALAPQTSGPYGRGWTSGYHRTLSLQKDGSALYVAQDGRHITFPANGTGGWGKPTGDDLTLMRNDDADLRNITYTVTEQDGATVTFDRFGLLTQLSDAQGLTVALSYGPNSQLESVTSPAGRIYPVSTDGAGHITKITVAGGASLTYTYNTDGYLESFTDADGDTNHYTYDAQGQMSEWSDGRGVRVIANEYDRQGRVIKQTDAAGNVSTVSYASNETTLTDAAGETTIYRYNDKYQTTAIEYAGTLTTKTFDEDGRLTRETDRLGRETTYTYDAAGNLTVLTRADGSYQRITYDAKSNPVEVRDFDGAITVHSYDSQGNIVATGYADGSTLSYAYDNLSRMTSLTDEVGNTTTFIYNGTDSLVTTDTLGNSTTTYYDEAGRVVCEVDALGIERKTMYSPAGKKVGTWMTGGITTAYAYDAAGNCVLITDERGVQSSYSYDAANRLVQATGPLGTSVTYGYDAKGNRISETDSCGNTTTYTYDVFGNVTSTTDALGNTETSTFDAGGRLSTVTDKIGVTTSYDYEGACDKPTRVTTDAGTTTYTYDDAGRLLLQTNPDNTSVTMSYDARGRLAQSIDVDGLETTFTYDGAGNLTDMCDSAGRSDRYSYDGAGNLTSVTDALGRVSTYTYDAAGRLISELAPGNRETRLVLDERGNITELIRPDGESLFYSYDAANNVTSATDALGNTTTYHLDDAGLVVATSDASGAPTTYSYTPNGQLAQRTGPLLETTDYVYDKANRLRSITDALGNTSVFDYDGAGQVVKTTLADGTVIDTVYDAQGNIVKETDSAGLVTEYVYDPMGYLIRQFDNAGFEAIFTNDAKGRVIEQTDATGRTATFGYDASGNLISTTDFNRDTTSFTYDLLRRVTHRLTGAGEDITYTYDEAGDLIAETDRFGRETAYTYDALGQSLSKTDALSQTWSYGYDLAGRVSDITTPEGITTHATYDGVGNLTSQSDGRGNITRSVYDASGNLIMQTKPNGAISEYAYDAAGNLTAKKDPLGSVTRYTYDALGRLSVETGPRGGTSTYTYDAHGNVISETDALGNVTTHSYSLASRLLKTTLPNGLEQTYDYDDVGRIIEAADSTGLAMSFVYDARGDVVGQTDQDGATSTFTYDTAHRMLTSQDALGAITTNTYDERGNLTSSTLPTGARISYTYDALNRAISSMHSSTSPVDFTYDSLGKVIQTTQGEKVYSYTYDGAGNQVSETDPLGNSATYTYNSVNLPTGYVNKNGDGTHIGYDLAGRAVSLQDTMGAKTSLAYDADGNITSTKNALGYGTDYTYDLGGNLINTTDALGRVATYTYDNRGNRISATYSMSATPRLYGASAQEQVMAASLVPETTYTYSYDLHNNLTEVVSPDGAVERFTYDVASRLISATQPSGQTIRYDYDKLGNLLAKTSDAKDTDATYAYGVAGERLSMDDVSGESTYTYDDAGRLITHTQAGGRSLRYSYDEYGRMARLTYPDGKTVSYTYDLGDNLICVSDSALGDTVYTYDGEGNVLTCTRPDDTHTTYGYDKAGRIIALINTQGSALLSSFSYTYDELGQITGEVARYCESEGEGERNITRSFGYDATGQLTGFSEDCDGETSTTTYSYDIRGNRIENVKAEDGYSVVYEYDRAGRLIKVTDGGTGEVSTLSYDKDGNLVSKRGEGTTTTYSYDTEDRLVAVREGGALLMAATYDGDGNRVFQLHRTVVPVGDNLNPLGAKNAEDERHDIAALDILPVVASTFGAQTPQAYYHEEKVYQNDFIDYSFWYGFGSMLVSAACIPDSAWLFAAQRDYNAAWNEFLSRFVLQTRYDRTDDYSDEDLEALDRAGLSDADIAGVTNPAATPKDAPAASPLDGTVLIPTNDGASTRYDYELTYYINDLSYQNAQVAMEYGKRGEAKQSYTYGTERITATDVTGEVDTYLYDGRGSVAQVLSVPGAGEQIASGGQATAQDIRSYTYDPYGTVTSDIDPYDLVFAYNAEEYNPVTGLQYLRARYYAPDTASFITQDSYLGRATSINSQNRYAFAESDPINNADPSGHAIGNTSYERQMESAGGINEIYNFYVGTTLQNSYNRASSAFYSKLNYAYGVNYTSQAAINSITGISQATANYYIDSGAAAAMAAGTSWGCTPGALTKAAINTFTTDVNTTRISVNSQINTVKANKQSQFYAYQAYLAQMAALAAISSRKIGALPNLSFSVTAMTAQMQLGKTLFKVKGVLDLLVHTTVHTIISNGTQKMQAQADSSWDWVAIGHTALDLAGLIPAVGEAFDAVNGIWYAAEGDALNAGLSFASTIPFAGYAATGTKIGIRVGKEIGGEALEAGAKEVRNVERLVNPPKGESEIWKSFDNVKGSSTKTDGVGNNKKYYEWDYTHNDIEVYDAKGDHLGSMDPTTGEMYKPPVPEYKLRQ